MRTLFLLFVFCSAALAQFGPNRGPGPFSAPRAEHIGPPLPTVQTVGARLDLPSVTRLPANVWLRFQRMPEVRELAALKHARITGTLVYELKAAPTVAECARLAHGPKGWRTILIVPAGARLRALHHVQVQVEILVPGAAASTVDELLKPYRNAQRATVSHRQCRHVMRSR